MSNPPPARMVISINSSWNIFNFRAGLIGALQDDGHEVVALAPRDDFSDKLEAMGCRFVPIAIDNKGTNPVLDSVLMATYRRRLKALKPDIYLGYTIKPNIYGSLAAHSLGIPVVNNVSGLGTAFLGSGPLQRLVEVLYKTSFRRSQRVFFQNEDDRAFFIERRIVADKLTGLLPGSGVDLDRFAPAPIRNRQPGEPLTVLMIGRVLYDKGVGEYVEAARRLKAEGFAARFAILGSLDAQNRTAVPRAVMEEWVREGTIDYLGTSTDVRPHIAAADCVVLPSYREGTPRTLLEAAAMARPVVATDVPGCRQAVDNGENGLLCRAKDSEDLARAIRALLAMTAEERNVMGEAGRRKMERQFDEHLVIEKYRREISAALVSRRRPEIIHRGPQTEPEP
jgi:glycosyltransferase involved in cell wall biosynthesis